MFWNWYWNVVISRLILSFGFGIWGYKCTREDDKRNISFSFQLSIKEQYQRRGDYAYIHDLQEGSDNRESGDYEFMSLELTYALKISINFGHL